MAYTKNATARACARAENVRIRVRRGQLPRSEGVRFLVCYLEWEEGDATEFLA